jgi:hypothetical protein
VCADDCDDLGFSPTDVKWWRQCSNPLWIDEESEEYTDEEMAQ